MSKKMNKGEDEVGYSRNGHGDEDNNIDVEDGLNGIIEGEDAADAQGSSRATYGDHTARMPVPKDATHYKMDHPRRGLAIIFNQENFNIHNLKARTGTKADRDNLEATFKFLGFEVRAFNDLCFVDIERHVKAAAREDHTHHDCIVLSFLTHGELGILYAKDMPYKLENLWSYFTGDKCPTLAGKPKMFFVQACQGDQLDGGVQMTETDGEVYTSYKIPVQADFLIVYSTVKGYYSWRNTTKGSWFIQALCDRLRELAPDYDLLTILTFVSQTVAVDFQSNCPDTYSMHQQKQIPCVMSMLTRLIKFPIVRPTVAGSDKENNSIRVQVEVEKSRTLFSGLFKGKSAGS